MHAVGEVDLQPPFEAGVAPFEDRFVDGRRAEMAARVAVLARAAIAANVGICDDQVTRLVLFVHRAAFVDVGELIEGQHVIDGGTRRRGRLEPHLGHPLVARFPAQLVDEAESRAARERRETRVDEPGEHAVPEALMEVPRRAQFSVRPRVFELSFVRCERRGIVRSACQSLPDRLGGKHSRLHAEMNSFQPHSVEKARRVADEEQPVAVRPRHREEPALRNSLGAIANHLAAVEHRANRRVLLHSLQLVVRIGRWVLVVETGHAADVEHVPSHPIDESAAERLGGQRISERMDYRAGFEAIVGKLPELLDARRVDLRLASLVETEPRRGLLGKRSSRSFAKHDDLRVDVGAGFVVGFRLAVVIETLVAGSHADHALLVPEQFLARKRGEDLRAVLLGDFSQPLGEFLKRRHVLAVVAQRGRGERCLELCPRGEKPKFVASDGRFHRGVRAPIRQQLVERPRIHDGARNPMVADLATLFDHEDLQGSPGCLGQLPEPNRSGEARWPGSTKRTSTSRRSRCGMAVRLHLPESDS